MNIRRAKEADIPNVLRLLSQVLEVHAAIRPDIFVSGTTKYGSEELAEMFADDRRPVYVAEIDGSVCILSGSGPAVYIHDETAQDNVFG